MPNPAYTHTKLLEQARLWMQQSWGRVLASVDIIFADESTVSLSHRISGFHVPTEPNALSVPDVSLFDAMTSWGHLQRGQSPVKIRMTAIDGAVAVITLPSPHIVTESLDPPANEWTLSESEIRYRGSVVPISGKKRLLLQMLVEEATVSAAELLAALWKPEDAATLQNVYVLTDQLRKVLRSHCGQDIVSAHGTYRLVPLRP